MNIKNRSRFSRIVFVLTSLLVSFLIISVVLNVIADEKLIKNSEDKLGYQTTPLIPGSKWHVHDGLRPQPVVVTPSVASTQEVVGTAPSDAIVLFDGKDLSQFTNKDWIIKDGYMEATKGYQISTDTFGDVQVHLEWSTPGKLKGDGQHRGNSGLFLMGKYEIQILDNYENQTYPDGQACAVYGQTPPLVNAAREPGKWQTYDIIFTAPRFDKSKKLVSPAYVTVIHNGVLVQNHTAFLGPTKHKVNTTYEFHEPKGPIKLQYHGSPVRFRNIWIRNLN